jgi:hypothetical protein
MKARLFTLLAVVLCMGIGEAANAQRVPSGPPAEVCKATNNLFGLGSDSNGNPIGFTFDECVRIVVNFNQSNGDTQGDFPVAFCNYLEQQGQLQAYGFSTVAQCISTAAKEDGITISATRLPSLLTGGSGLLNSSSALLFANRTKLE